MDLLLALTVLPPLYLMYRIWLMDKVEKEPVRLVAKVFFLGMLCCFPAGLLESVFSGILEAFLDPESLLFVALENFLIVGAAEEGCKLWVTKRSTWRNPEFNYRFDGIVYCAAASLGFACFENLFYVYGNAESFSVALIRAITSIPGHCTFGIMMGYYYGMAKLAETAGYPADSRRLLRRAFWVPLFLHGLYDFILSTDLDFLILLFAAYVIWLDLKAIRRAREAAAGDMPFLRQ